MVRQNPIEIKSTEELIDANLQTFQIIVYLCFLKPSQLVQCSWTKRIIYCFQFL